MMIESKQLLTLVWLYGSYQPLITTLVLMRLLEKDMSGLLGKNGAIM